MNSPLPQSSAIPSPALRVLAENESADLESVGCNESFDWVTVPSFLRRYVNPKPWGILNIGKFGKQAGQFLDGYGGVYQTVLDPVAGPLRVFPARILATVYKDMSAHLGWPKLESLQPAGPVLAPAPDAAGKAKAELGVKRNLISQLRVLAAEAQESEIRKSARILLATAEAECEALEAAALG